MLESFRIITNNPAVAEKNYAENEYLAHTDVWTNFFAKKY